MHCHHHPIRISDFRGGSRRRRSSSSSSMSGNGGRARQKDNVQIKAVVGVAVDPSVCCATGPAVAKKGKRKTVTESSDRCLSPTAHENVAAAITVIAGRASLILPGCCCCVALRCCAGIGLEDACRMRSIGYALSLVSLAAASVACARLSVVRCLGEAEHAAIPGHHHHMRRPRARRRSEG